MRVKNIESGYSTEIAEKYFSKDDVLIVVSPRAQEQLKFENNRPTESVEAQRVWFVTDEEQPFYVKFPASFQFTVNQFDQVKLVNLKAVEVRSNVYFSADNIEKVGK